MEKKPEMNKEPEEKKEADRSELTRSVKFVLFSISAGVVEIGVFTLLQELTGTIGPAISPRWCSPWSGISR